MSDGDGERFEWDQRRVPIFIAMREGDVEEVCRLCRPFPRELFSVENPAGAMVLRLLNKVRQKQEPAIVAFFECAAEDGYEDAFEVWTATDADSWLTCAQPIMGLVHAGFERVLRLFLDRGFDPMAKFGPSGVSAVEFSDRVGAEESGALFRSYIVRSLIDKTLGGANSPNL